MTTDELVVRIFEIAEEMGLRVEQRRPGKSIFFNEVSNKWLNETRIRALLPQALATGLSNSELNAMVETVAPGRPCTHKGFREILEKLRNELSLTSRQSASEIGE